MSKFYSSDVGSESETVKLKHEDVKMRSYLVSISQSFGQSGPFCLLKHFTAVYEYGSEL